MPSVASGRAHSVFLNALIMASRAGRVAWLIETVIPLFLETEWKFSTAPRSDVNDAIREILSWKDRPSLRSHMNRLLCALDPNFVEDRAEFPSSQWQSIVDSKCAFALANFLKGNSVKDTLAAAAMSADVRGADLPSVKNFTPRAFMEVCKRRRLEGFSFQKYLVASAFLLTLQSKQGSLKPMSSALVAWGSFCDLLKVEHFPVCPVRVAQFATVCREASTFANYVSHVKSACELFSMPTDWAADPRIKRAKAGLIRAALVFKGPKLAVDGAMIARIANVSGVWASQRFFVVLSWVFMLRAKSEASLIRRARTQAEINDLATPLPAGVHGVLGVCGQTLVLRLRSRKSAIFGDAVRRSCTCVPAKGVSLYIPSSLCPIHVLWPWVVNRRSPGELLFDHLTVSTAAEWLEIALAARDVPSACKFGLHALRRGAARELVRRGGDLPTLLKAGGWKSSAFKSYLDMMGLEDEVFSASVQTLVDLDDAEP